MHDSNRSSPLSVRRPVAAASGESPLERSGSASTHPQPDGQAATPASAERALRSDALLQGRSHVSILHNGETYQLRATRLGKLILTK